MSDGEGITTYSYDLNNRLTQTNEICGDREKITSYFYDYNGNQVIKASRTNHPYEGKEKYTISGETNEDIAIYE